MSFVKLQRRDLALAGGGAQADELLEFATAQHAIDRRCKPIGIIAGSGGVHMQVERGAVQAPQNS